MSDSVGPHRRQPTRLPRPWDSPGRNTGVSTIPFSRGSFQPGIILYQLSYQGSPCRGRKVHKIPGSSLASVFGARYKTTSWALPCGQWSGLCASTAGGPRWVPGRGTEILHALPSSWGSSRPRDRTRVSFVSCFHRAPPNSSQTRDPTWAPCSGSTES